MCRLFALAVSESLGQLGHLRKRPCRRWRISTPPQTHQRNIRNKRELSMNAKNSAVPPNEPVRCAIYARMASNLVRQSSAAEQIELCKDAVHKAGWAVVEDCVRADVGKPANTINGCCGLSELLALAGTRPRPFDTLICESQDKLGRRFGTAGPIVDALTNDGVRVFFAAQHFGTNDPVFEILMRRDQEDLAALLSHGARIRQGIQRSKLEKAKKLAA